MTFVLALGSGCARSPAAPAGAGDGESSGSGATARAAALLDAGWRAFEVGDYAGAAVRFDAALALDNTLVEGHSGRGWSLARGGDYGAASTAFAAALELDGAALDALAGQATVEAVRGRDAPAIAAAGALLARAADYRFAHDARVAGREIRWLRAQLYLRGGNYAAAAADLDRLAPDAAPHASAPAALLAALAALGGALAP